MTMLRNLYNSMFGYSGKEWSIGGAFAAIGGVLAAMVGGFDTLFKVLMITMAFDVITGVWGSCILKIISSEKGIKGLHKKVGVLIMISFAFYIDTAFGQTGLLRAGAVTFYLAMEGLSLIENLTAMGVPAFQPLKDYLVQLKEGSKKGPSKLIEPEEPKEES